MVNAMCRAFQVGKERVGNPGCPPAVQTATEPAQAVGNKRAKTIKEEGDGGTLTNLQLANPQEQKTMERARGGLSTLTTS